MAEPIVGLAHVPIDVAALRARFSDTTRGAVFVFEGVVRSITGEQVTTKLTYTAYEEMALLMMSEIAESERDADVAIIHRLGELLPGETAVVCIAACGHRDEAFAACRRLIDRVKADVPIWKEEC